MMNKPGVLSPSPGLQHIIKVMEVRLTVTVSKQSNGLKIVPMLPPNHHLKVKLSQFLWLSTQLVENCLLSAGSR